jgi:peptidoglycan/LPS O-acetylase OafA/YrhL
MLALIVIAGQLLYLLGNDTWLDTVYNNYQHVFFLLALGVGAVLTASHITGYNAGNAPVPAIIITISVAAVVAMLNVVYWSLSGGTPALGLIWETFIAFLGVLGFGMIQKMVK